MSPGGSSRSNAESRVESGGGAGGRGHRGAGDPARRLGVSDPTRPPLGVGSRARPDLDQNQPLRAGGHLVRAAGDERSSPLVHGLRRHTRRYSSDWPTIRLLLPSKLVDAGGADGRRMTFELTPEAPIARGCACSPMFRIPAWWAGVLPQLRRTLQRKFDESHRGLAHFVSAPVVEDSETSHQQHKHGAGPAGRATSDGRAHLG